MPPRPVRWFTLIDAMILVAAAALAFGGIRAELTPHLHPSIIYTSQPFVPPPAPSYIAFSEYSTTVSAMTSVSLAGPVSSVGGYSAWFSRAWAWAGSARAASSCLAALSLAMLAIRLRRPRPPWPRLIRQAGLVASLGATFTLGIRLGHALLKLLLESLHPTITMGFPTTGPAPSRLSWIACQTTQPYLIGVVVLASWLILALGGRRHRERGWIDRCGIVVGLGWVVMLAVELFRNEPA